jgi:hypothetical protein
MGSREWRRPTSTRLPPDDRWGLAAPCLSIEQSGQLLIDEAGWLAGLLDDSADERRSASGNGGGSTRAFDNIVDGNGIRGDGEGHQKLTARGAVARRALSTQTDRTLETSRAPLPLHNLGMRPSRHSGCTSAWATWFRFRHKESTFPAWLALQHRISLTAHPVASNSYT